MSTVLHSAPKFVIPDAGALASLGQVREEHGEVILTVARGDVSTVLQGLRDDHQFQQLMEIAGADYPSRAERFEVVYMLLSVTKNQRLLVKTSVAEGGSVPSVTHLWPVAGWLEREVYDMYGVIFAGNDDLRRILTDYGFEGHPFRKDFPLTGYQELRYSDEVKRVVYEPVKLAQDLRQFDFQSPWEGSDYVLPGDEKAVQATPPPPASAPAPAPVKEVREVDAKPKKAAAKKPAAKKAAPKKGSKA